MDLRKEVATKPMHPFDDFHTRATRSTHSTSFLQTLANAQETPQILLDTPTQPKMGDAPTEQEAGQPSPKQDSESLTNLSIRLGLPDGGEAYATTGAANSHRLFVASMGLQGVPQDRVVIGVPEAVCQGLPHPFENGSETLNDSLKARKKTLQARNQTLQARNDRLVTRNHQWQAQVAELQAELYDLKIEKASACTDVSALCGPHLVEHLQAVVAELPKFIVSDPDTTGRSDQARQEKSDIKPSSTPSKIQAKQQRSNVELSGVSSESDANEPKSGPKTTGKSPAPSSKAVGRSTKRVSEQPRGSVPRFMSPTAATKSRAPASKSGATKVVAVKPHTR